MIGVVPEQNLNMYKFIHVIIKNNILGENYWTFTTLESTVYIQSQQAKF